ncbi:capsule biosynthesis GfcC D2 domain-containing protein [Phytobacter sp. V91]|uniref:capsule biosynthesis GfcC D2 domain-containing protein n=1 Tax=Phytobacter sp. V91 TaxID=3369425 RepID=UPI003F6024CC
MNMRFCLTLVLSLLSSQALAAGTVEVYTAGDGKPKTLTDAAHLIDVVGQPRLAQSWWPGAVISERQASAVATERQQALLSRLGTLASEESGDDAAAINALRQQVQLLQVTGRQQVNLDPDYVRVEAGANPPLDGNYSLWVGPQPDTITVFGLVSQPGKKTFTPGRDVVGYLDEMSLLSGAEKSEAWLIYPNGRTQKVPVAYWNRRHVEPMPGSTIFVGFSSALWGSRYEALNADILYSLTHRIPEQ